MFVTLSLGSVGPRQLNMSSRKSNSLMTMSHSCEVPWTQRPFCVLHRDTLVFRNLCWSSWRPTLFADHPDDEDQPCLHDPEVYCSARDQPVSLPLFPDPTRRVKSNPAPTTVQYAKSTLVHHLSRLWSLQPAARQIPSMFYIITNRAWRVVSLCLWLTTYGHRHATADFDRELHGLWTLMPYNAVTYEQLFQILFDILANLLTVYCISNCI